jgi:protein-L-isoaspartate(D-aspartate) O-methyltransferase
MSANQKRLLEHSCLLHRISIDIAEPKLRKGATMRPWRACISRLVGATVLAWRRRFFLPALRHAKENVGRMQFLLDLRRHGIMDAGVLRAMEEVPREKFVMTDHVRSAYADQALPILCGQTISQPYVVAYMTEQLALGPPPDHHVLEIGTGSGYQAAILSRLAAKVTSIERYRTLAEQARARLAALGYHNVEVIAGDGMAGAPDQAPFDRIIVTAAADEIPSALVDQLVVGGIMILPLGPRLGDQVLVRLTRTETGVERNELIGVRFVPLVPGQAREL